jgi:hypothetical protein
MANDKPPKKTNKGKKLGTRVRAPLKPSTGRPSVYDPEYHPIWAYRFALLGATGKQIAELLDIDEKTFEDFKKKHPAFLQSVIDGGDRADAEVAEMLYHRAKGYTHNEEKIFCSDGTIVRAKTEKHYPPDVKAASLWLSNRQNRKWKDRQSVEVTASDDVIAMMQEARARANLDSDK